MKLTIVLLGALAILSLEIHAGFGGYLMKKGSRLAIWDNLPGDEQFAAGVLSCVIGGAALVCTPIIGGYGAVAGILMLGATNTGEALNLQSELEAEVKAGRLTREDSNEISSDLEQVKVSELAFNHKPVQQTVEVQLGQNGYQPKTAQFIASVLTR